MLFFLKAVRYKPNLATKCHKRDKGIVWDKKIPLPRIVFVKKSYHTKYQCYFLDYWTAFDHQSIAEYLRIVIINWN